MVFFNRINRMHFLLQATFCEVRTKYLVLLPWTSGSFRLIGT